MSVPTDPAPEAAQTVGTQELKRWVDAYVHGGCSATTLNRSLTALCRDNPGAASDALSLLARYDEEGQLRLRNLEFLTARLESAARGEASSALDPATAHGAGAATVLLPVPGTAPGTAPGTEVLAVTQSLDPGVSIQGGEHGRRTPPLVVEAPRGRLRAPIGPGSVLRDRYVLEDELGSGGMGTVYRALDRNRLDLAYESRYVALKVLRAEYSRRPEAVAALRREFLQAQSLAHPGLVKVLDFDRDGDTHFITMELLDGELLSGLIERLRPGKLPRNDALRILGALGSAVVHAHEHGVLHLDLKPGNVMITTHDEVRILDFGLAHPHVREPWISDGPPAFHAATPTYASCERIAGTSPDARDDVFSLACIAYELLSGEHPFNRSSAREARAQGLKIRRIRDLGRRPWQTLSRGLAWAREDRIRTVAELLDGLGLETVTPRLSGRSRPERASGRPRRTLGPLLLLALFAAAFALYLQRDQWRPMVTRLLSQLESLAPVRRGQPEAQGAPPSRSAIAPPTRPQSERQPQMQPPSESAPQTQALPDSAPMDSAPAPDDATGPVAGNGTAAAAATIVQSAGVLARNADALPESAAPAAQTGPEPAPAATTAQESAPTAPRRRGRVQLAADSLTVSESEPAARVRIRRVGGSDGRISFLWRTQGHSAIGDEDYAELGWNEEVLGPGQVSTTLIVPIVADQRREHTELFDVVLGTTEDDTVLGPITSTTVILVDDD